MGSDLEVAVITPEGAAFEGRAKSVVVPAHDGEVAFLPRHAPFVGALGTGELRVTTGAGTERYFLDGGVVQVIENVVSILAEKVERKDVVVARAEEARADLAAALALVPTDEEAFAAKEHALARARARLRMADS
jgi:F-type H+-transporting ATPase subunit epsilon